MKTYIVTSGEYSDYSIRKVFLNKKKAEKYVKIKNKGNGFDSYQIEEYETSDDEEFETFYVMTVNYSASDGYYFEFELRNTLDNKPEDSNRSGYFIGFGKSKHTLYLERLIPKKRLTEQDKEKLIEKYKKVCQDYMTKIDSLMQIEGWTFGMVSEWIGNEGNMLEEVKK